MIAQLAANGAQVLIEKNTMREAIDKIISSSFTLRGNSGLVVGFSQGGRRWVFGYGKLSERNIQTPNGDTLFGIGSVTKVFTTALLSVLVSERLLTLGNPVCDLVPALSNLPSKITLLRLATHTSGLPHMPSNICASMLRDRHNPYASYTIEKLLDWLSKYGRKIKLPLKEEVHYSNMGMALLGFILAQKVDTSYEQAIFSRICAPLGLGDTRITLTPDQKERLSVPHSARGLPAEIWDLPAFLGAGALLSTASDLLSFLDAHLGTPQSALTEPMRACHEIITNALPPPGFIQRLVTSLIGSEKDLGEYRHGMALGWNVGQLISTRGRLYWHHGATGGYRAFIGFVKDSETAVVVLANSGLSGLDALLSTTSTDMVGLKVMELLNSSVS